MTQHPDFVPIGNAAAAVVAGVAAKMTTKDTRMTTTNKERAQSIPRQLDMQAEAARALIDSLKHLSESLDDDERHDALEGETNLLETMELALDEIEQSEAMIVALDEQIEKKRTKRDRLKDRIEMIRAAMLHAMVITETKTLRLPAATVSLANGRPKTEILDESVIPGDFFTRAAPRLDKKALYDALKAGADIPGATLSNAAPVLKIR